MFSTQQFKLCNTDYKEKRPHSKIKKHLSAIYIFESSSERASPLIVSNLKKHHLSIFEKELRQAGMIGFITLQQSAPSQMT
jgi:hypothetical protein